jgi:hypothetical protein
MTLTNTDLNTCITNRLQDSVRTICAAFNISEDVFISEAIEAHVDFFERQLAFYERLNDSEFIFTHEPLETTNPAEMNEDSCSSKRF